MYDGLRRILIEEGWAGLYKGIVPSVIKAAPAGAVTFVAYEYTSDWLESKLTWSMQSTFSYFLVIGDGNWKGPDNFELVYFFVILFLLAS